MLRPVSAGDQVPLHAIFTQAGVRRYIFDNQTIPPERTAEIIHKSTALFDQRGFGLWLAFLRRSVSRDLRHEFGSPTISGMTPTVVGFGAFWFFRDPPELELLYGVSDDHLKQGYGREIAQAVIAYGLETLKMPTIRASTDPAHADSRRLLEELGFVFERRERVAGLDTVFYELQARSWLMSRPTTERGPTNSA